MLLQVAAEVLLALAVGNYENQVRIEARLHVRPVAQVAGTMHVHS